jgi:hypothetical protein
MTSGAIPDHRQSCTPRLLQLPDRAAGQTAFDLEAERRSFVVNVNVQVITPFGEGRKKEFVS